MSQAELLSPAPLSPSVSLHSGRPGTTSLEVAKFFGKRHTDVLRDVNNFSANCPEEFSQRNFASAEYSDEQGKPRPMFILYRDGFMLLVMGYTGKKALAMKLAYIEAFNRMEAELAARRQTALSASDAAASLPLSTTEDRKPLRALVGSWAQVSGLPFAACWNQLKAAFQLANIKELPQAWLPDALAWVQHKMDTLTAPSLPTGKESLTVAPASPAADAEEHLAAIRQHISRIYDHEAALYGMARRNLPSRWNAPERERRIALRALDGMERAVSALDATLACLEAGVRTALAAGRM